jgi:adenylosuccinate lyase
LVAKPGEVGSSTMPQKVNPIDFENAEGNLGIANALLEHYARKLPITRLQRDLSDSTVRRTFGEVFGHALVAYSSFARGLGRLEVNQAAMRSELEAHWEIIAEGAQTILRLAGVANPYELLKELTRGKGLTEDSYKQWVDELEVDEGVRAKLRSLTLLNYVGLAEQITEASLKD